MGDVVRMSDVKHDGTLWTVEQMLEDALKDCREGKRKMVKGTFVYLWEKPNGCLGVGTFQAGMTHAEEVGFLEMAKLHAMEDWRA